MGRTKSIITDDMEIWRTLPYGDCRYMVSNHGRVLRLWTYKVASEGLRKVHKEKILSPTDNGNGYKIVSLQIDGKRKNKYVHRLVAEMFVEKPEGKNVVNHLDFDKSNNRASNLEWCTQRENTEYSRQNFKKQHNVRVSPNTGERYISKRKNGLYRVSISSKTARIDKGFKNLSDAIEFRNKVCDEIGYTI